MGDFEGPEDDGVAAEPAASAASPLLTAIAGVLLFLGSLSYEVLEERVSLTAPLAVANRGHIPVM